MTKVLTQYQLFVTKRENLEKKIEEFYNDTKQTACVIQYALAIMVKNAFSTQDFSYFAKELVCSLFLTSSVEELNSVRNLCVYFEDYFTEDEWVQVIDRLFENQIEYAQLTEQTRLRIEKLRPILNVGEQAGEKKLTLKALFKDESGKGHNWSLSNVVALRSSQEHRALLNILGELTIFQKEGIRRFTEVVWLDFSIDERFRDFDIRNEEDPNYQPDKLETGKTTQQKQKTDEKKPRETGHSPQKKDFSQVTDSSFSEDSTAKGQPKKKDLSLSGTKLNRTKEEILEEKRRIRGKGKNPDLFGEQAKKREEKKKEQELRKKLMGNNKPKKNRKRKKRK
ncbi:hypothetical protein [Enterococcus sp. AZ163]|uniref:hypothetical protein n=2 Tax=Enterococcus TaxID=1350 RepID=UPI003D268A85